MEISKPYFRSKGKYSDGRKRIVIEWREEDSVKSLALPKPEELLKTLSSQENLDGLK